jgi:hypothetical protein
MSQMVRKADDPIRQTTAELEKSSVHAVATNITRSEQTVDSIMNRRRTLMHRLFPDAVDRAQADGELTLVRTEYEFRTRTLKILRESQIQTLQEVFNNYLVQGKAGLRADTAVFLTQKKRELESEIQTLWNENVEQLTQEFDRAAGISNDRLRDLTLERLDDRMIGFAELVKKLIGDFDNIASEAIRA